MTTTNPMQASGAKRQCWCRFSLRFVLVAVFVIALGLAWLAARLQQARRQQAAVIAIHQLGGYVQYHNGLDTCGVPATPATPPSWIRRVGGDDFFDRVQCVKLQRAHDLKFILIARIDPSRKGTQQCEQTGPWNRENVLALGPHFEALRDLESISFRDTAMPRDSLAAIANLSKLRSLDLHQTRITSADLKDLKNLTRLERLVLRRTRIRDDGLAHLRGMDRLLELSLGSTAIGDAGLEKIVHLTELRWLNLENTQVTDKGISHLRNLTKLHTLYLGLTKVSDASVEHLSQLAALRTLVVGNRVTEQGIARLRSSLPNCEIRWSRYRHRSPHLP